MTSVEQLRRSCWTVQPRWLRAAALCVALPAWLVIAYNIMSDHYNAEVVGFAGAAFTIVALLQLAYLFRAYWQHEL